MKQLYKMVAALGAALLIGTGSSAQDWSPPGPVKLMIAFRAGGGADTQARMIASALEAKLGWQFIPEQVTGKGGLNLANALKDQPVNMLKALSQQPGDGTAIGMAVTESLGYNLATSDAGLAASDFVGLSTTAGFQLGIIGQTEDGWKTMQDVIAAAKGGQQIKVGVMSPRLADLTYLLEKANDVSFNIVSYRGGKAVLDAIVAGDVDVGYVAGPQAKGVAAGDLVELASALSVPLKATPDAPLLSDLGVNFDADGYFVFVAPAGLPPEAQEAFAKAIASVVTDQNEKVTGIINKVFGGAVTIQSTELDSYLQQGFDAAGALLEAVSE